MSARRTRLFTCLSLCAAACAPAQPPVSYAGLDAPLDAEAPPPIWIGVLADTTGPEAITGRAFAERFREQVESASPVRGRELRVRVLDDRSRPESIDAAAERIEDDVGVLLVVTAPGADRAARAAEVAYRTPLVGVNDGAAAALREGAFVLVTIVDSDARAPTDPREIASVSESEATSCAKWILTALRAAPEWGVRDVAATLRARLDSFLPLALEGQLPAREPYLFRAPPASTPKH